MTWSWHDMATKTQPATKVTQTLPQRQITPAVVATAPLPVPAPGRLRPSRAERDIAGKALRERLPATTYGAWKRPADRGDPIAILRASDAGRMQELVPIRYGRMLQSPFTYFRGAAAVMATDLAGVATTGLRVQACGDCHLMNFGGFATPERNVIFDINDFDETLPAPFEWDLKRLGASFVLAARAIGLSDSKGLGAATACARAYRRGLRDFVDMHPSKVWYARLSAEDLLDRLPKRIRTSVERRIEKALAQTGSEMDFPKLTHVVGGQSAIRDTPPLIFHPESSRAPEFKEILDESLAAYCATLAEDRRALLGRYNPVDAAIKVVGIGSVGRRCWVVLLMSDSNEPLFLQFKEAVASVLEPHAGASTYQHHGQRVVMGQRMMQPSSDPFLGWVTARTGTQFYVRQLRDAKIKPMVETFDAEMLDIYARTCGGVLARAHAKAGEVTEIAAYLGSGDKFDEALGRFAVAYADQTERDHAALKAAVRKGQVEAFREA